MNDKEKMLEFAKQTYREMVKQIDEMIPDEEPEMTPSYAIEYMKKIKTSLEIEIHRYKNSIGFRDGSMTIADHELIEKYRTVKYVIELLGELEE